MCKSNWRDLDSAVAAKAVRSMPLDASSAPIAFPAASNRSIASTRRGSRDVPSGNRAGAFARNAAAGRELIRRCSREKQRIAGELQCMRDAFGVDVSRSHQTAHGRAPYCDAFGRARRTARRPIVDVIGELGLERRTISSEEVSVWTTEDSKTAHAVQT